MTAPVVTRSRRWKRAMVATLAAASIAAALAAWGRTTAPEVLDLAPVLLQDVQRRDAPAEADVALVLGGGGLRGFAHIGVLQALEERGIKPDIVVGTSAGAIVGAAYASGASPAQLEQEAVDIDLPGLMDWTLEPGGLMRGVEISRWVNRVTRGQSIESFPTRFGAVATELRNGQAVLLEAGRPGDAVRASAAVPGATVPVSYAGGALVDGGVTSLVPVRFARGLGARTVIAVDVYCVDDSDVSERANSALSAVRRSMRIQTCLVSEQELAEADISIRVKVPMPTMSGVESRRAAIAAGYQAARQSLDLAKLNEPRWLLGAGPPFAESGHGRHQHSGQVGPLPVEGSIGTRSLWLRKMKGPTIRRRAADSTRLTSKPPRFSASAQ